MKIKTVNNYYTDENTYIVYDEKYKGSQIDANDLLSSVCMLDDSSEHYVVDAFE